MFLIPSMMMGQTTAEDQAKLEAKVDGNVTRLTKMLKLDEKQQAEAKTIFMSFSEDMKKMKDLKLEKKETIKERREMVYSRRMAIMEILNEDQKKKMEKYNKRLERADKRLKKTVVKSN